MTRTPSFRPQSGVAEYEIDGGRLRARRMELDMNAKDVAAEAGVHFGHIYNVEACRERPGLRLAHRLCRILDLNPDDVIIWAKDDGGPDRPPQQPKNPTKEDNRRREEDAAGTRPSRDKSLRQAS